MELKRARNGKNNVCDRFLKINIEAFQIFLIWTLYKYLYCEYCNKNIMVIIITNDKLKTAVIKFKDSCTK